MKKLLLPILAMLALPAYADFEFQALTKKEIEDVTTEFATNFSHTAVAAPETDGMWGVEVGVVAGQTGTPKLKDAVNKAGGDGDDVKNLYHAGLVVRAHFPYDIFAEANILPERKISEASVASKSFGLGWNLGAFLGLPLDIALGANASSSNIDFKQDIGGNPGKVMIDAKTQVLWVGVSKTFLFVTPYVKVGSASQESEIDISAQSGTIFGSGKQKEDATNSGGYFAAGLNLQLAFFKIGAEYSQTMDVKRASGKISLDF